MVVDFIQMMSPIAPSLLWKNHPSLRGRPLKVRVRIHNAHRQVSCGSPVRSYVCSARKRLKACRLYANASGSSGLPHESSSTGPQDQNVMLRAHARIVGYMTSYMTRLGSWISYMAERADLRAWNNMIQFAASVAFVALYVWGTYSQPAKGSLRASLDLWLCLIFAGEFLHRLIFNHKDFGSRLRMLTNPLNGLDLLSFTPTLFEVLMQQISPGFSLRRFDLRWTKLLRGLRVIRIGLLAAELRSLNLSTKRGGWLAAGTTFRLVQLAATPILLLFGASAIFQILEHIPFHKAVYFVATTLSTVGFGDVVAQTVFGKAFVVVMIAVGLVLIPVQAALFYNEISARRVIKGTLPDWRGKPFVLLSTRLIEVRAFSDLYAEFQQALGTTSLFPKDTKIVALCNRPSFEFSAFQELHERSLTLVEGSAVSGSDLVTARAEKANAIILLADRFSTDSSHEDLSILFQVWAAKSYTKTVPLFVQTMKQSTVEQIKPFLDPDQDVAVSMEETRFRLIALSASCPGASTLIGNLIRSSNVRPEDARQDTLAGRKWLRQYVDGCEAMLCRAPVQRHLVGIAFNKVAEWLYRIHGHAIIGIIDTHGKIHLNPSEWILEMGCTLLVVGHGTVAVRKALASRFTPHDTCVEISEDYPDSKLEALSSFENCQQIYEGLPTTESVDIDDIPCIPKYLSESMDPIAGSAFYQRYRQDGDAVEEQVERGYLSEETSVRLAQEAGIASSPSQPPTEKVRYEGHFILCGHSESFIQFMRYLRAAEPSEAVEIVILAEEKPEGYDIAQEKYGPVDFITGSPTHASSLRQAGAQTARALIFLTKGSRDVQTAQGTGSAVEVVRNTREAVLADASALLACYGVGEESGTALTHAVVELLFTTSIEFLQPGLLLKGVNSMYDESSVRKGQPRKSWSMRALQQREAVSEGLAEWQANPYYAAGRCTVPALMDTFATQGFFTRGLLFDVLGELCGDFSDRTGAMLVQCPLPPGMAGRTFEECFTSLAISKQMIVIGLYRKKIENPATRLSYVMTLPPPGEILQNTDRLFVIRNQGKI